MNPTGQTLLQGRPYKNSASTDVRETWKRFAWATPSERIDDEQRRCVDSPAQHEGQHLGRSQS